MKDPATGEPVGILLEDAFREELEGPSTRGNLADVTVLPRETMAIPPSEILETEVSMTIVVGEAVYKKQLS